MNLFDLFPKFARAESKLNEAKEDFDYQAELQSCLQQVADVQKRSLVF